MGIPQNLLAAATVSLVPVRTPLKELGVVDGVDFIHHGREEAGLSFGRDQQPVFWEVKIWITKQLNILLWMKQPANIGVSWCIYVYLQFFLAMLPSNGNLGFISLAVELWLVADYHFGVAIPQTLVNEGSLVRGWQVYLIESHPNMYPSVLKRSLIETQRCSSMTFPAVNLRWFREFPASYVWWPEASS